MADTIANDAVAVTKSDSTVVDITALYVGATGDVTVITWRGTTVTFPTVPAGTILPIRCTKVMSTNTTASSFVGLKY